jgi:predicted kinase
MKTLDKADINSYLDTHYLRSLSNLTVAHPKLLIVFSGGNGVGKSSLSAKIQAELQALVLENDAIRTALLEYKPELDKDRQLLGKLVWEYTQELYPRLESVTTNGLVVRDAVIDWYFDKILPVFKQNKYEIFIVRFELSREKQLELLRKRGGKAWIPLDVLEGMLDSHDAYSKRFLSMHTPDVVITDKTVFDYEPVIEALRKKLSQLQIL